MQGTAPQSGNQNGQQKQGGLSWTQSPSSGGSKPAAMMPNAAKPAPSTTPVMPLKTSAPMQQKSITTVPARNGTSGAKLTGIFLAGVIVGLIIGWGWFSLSGNKGGEVASNNTAASGTTSAGDEDSATPVANTGSNTNTGGTSNSLTVANTTAGNSVAVSGISVSVPTWIVVLDNKSGVPGNALGAQMFFPGQTSGTINLLRATVAGQSYLLGEYVDNGDHVFSKREDTAVNTVAGTQMLVQFTAR